MVEACLAKLDAVTAQVQQFESDFGGFMLDYFQTTQSSATEAFKKAIVSLPDSRNDALLALTSYMEDNGNTDNDGETCAASNKLIQSPTESNMELFDRHVMTPSPHFSPPDFWQQSFVPPTAKFAKSGDALIESKMSTEAIENYANVWSKRIDIPIIYTKCGMYNALKILASMKRSSPVIHTPACALYARARARTLRLPA